MKKSWRKLGFVNLDIFRKFFLILLIEAIKLIFMRIKIFKNMSKIKDLCKKGYTHSDNKTVKKTKW